MTDIQPTPDQIQAAEGLRGAGVELRRQVRFTRNAIKIAQDAGIPVKDIRYMVAEYPGNLAFDDDAKQITRHAKEIVKLLLA